MKLNVRHNLLRYAATVVFGVVICGLSYGQTPTPAAPVSVTDPRLNDPMTQALEPVRQAIARQDYAAAQAALDIARQQNPNHPGIALYESMIQRRQVQGQTLDTQSPLRTPRAGVTPMPIPAENPVVEITPESGVAPPAPAPGEPAEAPAPAAADDTISGKISSLWENELVRYGIFGIIGLVVLALAFLMFKKRRARVTGDYEEPEYESPMGTGVTTMGGMDDHLEDTSQPGGLGGASTGLGGAAAGLTSSPASPDFSASAEGAGTGGALGGSSLSGGMAGYSMPSFGADEEEEEAPAPPKNTARQNPVDDDALVNFSFDEDEPKERVESPATPAGGAEPKAVSDDASIDSLGKKQQADQPAVPSQFDEETVILSSPEAAPAPSVKPAGPAPLSPSGAPGTVDLEDIFGSQPLPGADTSFETVKEPTSAPDKLPVDDVQDANSETLSTFVSKPGTDNPEENAEIPPKTRQRPAADKGSETGSISFEELFGSGTARSTPAETPEAVPEPEPEVATGPELEPEPEAATGPELEPEPKAPAKPAAELSIEEALAATLGDMQALSPEAEQASAPKPAAAEVAGESTESLDERTERMFGDQMAKARAAMAEKNWRQAVHVLSIASALHPENEEAKQMLKEARAEKRKSEESV